MCILPGKVVPEMTYTVSGVTLNPALLLTHLHIFVISATGSSTSYY